MLEKLLKKYPAGSDITIMNCFYQYARTNEVGEKEDDFIAIVFKDNTTGIKDHIIIKNPKYKFYVLKPEVPADYNKLFVEKELLDEYEVPFRRLEKEMAKVLGREADYNDAVMAGDRDAIRALHLDPRVFNSDQSIEDKYRHEFSTLYPNNIKKINKAYFDIEVDGRYCSTEFPEPELAEAPINAISFLDERTNREISFLLNDPVNPLIQKFKSEYESGIFKEDDIREFVKNAVGGYKKFVRNKLDNTQFELRFFDNEIELIQAFFETVYELDPDFIEGWNSSGFDLNYIMHRIHNLGYDPKIIMSDKRWEFPYLKLYVDERNKNEFAERGDYLNLACNVVWLDQMIQFCSRRKSSIGSFTSFKLDDIGQLTAGVKKLNYSHITTNLTELPYLDYKTFVLYNIMDVVVQKCIENKAQDLEYVFAKAIANDTSYKKVHRQSVYLVNRMTKEWEKMGLLIGNNTNKGNEKPPKFAGALVGNPLYTSDYAKIKLDGVPIMVCDNLQDFDFKSLYPSVLLEFNIAPNTQVGRINIWNPIKGTYSHKDYTVTDSKGNTKTVHSNKIIPEGTYYIRIDNEDNPFVYLYKDYKYKEQLGVLYLPTESNIKKHPHELFIKEEWELQEVKIYKDENAFNVEHYMRAGEYIENLVSDNILEFSKRWLHLAGIKEFLIDWNEYNQQFLRSYSTNGWYGYTHYYEDRHEVIECPVVDSGNRKAEQALIKCNTPEIPFRFYGTLKESGININEFR